eukprot:jgi/Astpho2/275/Aster-02165
MSKRELLATTVAVTLGLQQFAEADALETELRESGMKQPPELLKRYYDQTQELHGHMRAILDIKGAPDSNPAAVKAFGRDANDWSADYRRLVSPSRKSFAETYGAINALQGQLNAGKLDKALPKKLRENLEKRLTVAEKALKRERSQLT